MSKTLTDEFERTLETIHFMFFVWVVILGPPLLWTTFVHFVAHYLGV